jgi:hypothetical protein
MKKPEFRTLPFAEAVEELNLQAHFGDHMFEQYGEDGQEVRFYEQDATIDGDLDLDALFNDENVAGIFVARDLNVAGSILNWEIDTTAAFLAVGRDLVCRHLIASGADIRVRRDVKASGVVVATYNHGYMEISRNASARHFIVDDHQTIVGGQVKAPGWKMSGSAEAGLKDSDWIAEIRPEARDEFFDERGDVKCGSGNVDLVKALMEGREILKA